MNLQHEPIKDSCVLFQIRNGVNIPVLQDTTAKSNTNYFEEQQYQLKVTSSVNISETSLTQWWNFYVQTCEVVNWKIGSFPETTQNLFISGALPALMALLYIL